MERPAAPAPPKPCRPILDVDPLFPRYKIRGVLAAGARRPLRFGGVDGAARPWGTGPCLPGLVPTRRGFLGCPDLHFVGEGPRRGPKRWRAQTLPLVVSARSRRRELRRSRRQWLVESRRPLLVGRCCRCCGPRQSAAGGGGGDRSTSAGWPLLSPHRWLWATLTASSSPARRRKGQRMVFNDMQLP